MGSYPIEDATWEPEDYLTNAKDLVDEYRKKQGEEQFEEEKYNEEEFEVKETTELERKGRGRRREG